ncbi:MAG: FlgD immunoglobulin-like domain containing protein [Candidatus Eisenbacteria bacterium]
MTPAISTSTPGRKAAIGGWLGFFVFITCLYCLYGTAAYGQSSGQIEVGLINEMPQEIMDHMAGGNRPDANGMIGYNSRNGWTHVVFQRGAMFYLAVAAARDNHSQVADAWRAIDVAFDRQTPAGNFETGQAVPRIDDLSGVSFWLAKLCHALLVLQGSSVGPAYQDEINQLLPKIRSAATWLAQGQNDLALAAADAPNRFFFHACAFGLAGILLDDDNFRQIGRNFVDMGLDTQREDGVFVEHGGHDSSYQATSLLQLQQYAIHNPVDPAIEDAIRRGMEWELPRIEWNGRVDVTDNTRTGAGQEEFMGQIKDVNYPEVILALFYYGARNDCYLATNAGIRVYEFITGQARTVRWGRQQCQHDDDWDEFDPMADDYLGDNTLAQLVSLDQTYPNPCSETTVIRYTLPADQSAHLTIYDVHGREIRSLTDGHAPAGLSQVVWDTKDNAGNRVSPGVYVCRLATEGLSQTRKISVVK